MCAVIRLATSMIIYYFSVPLPVYLYHRGIFVLSTIIRNRIPDRYFIPKPNPDGNDQGPSTSKQATDAVAKTQPRTRAQKLIAANIRAR